MGAIINLEIDILSESVIEVSTGKVYQTFCDRAEIDELKNIKKSNKWKFDWYEEFKNENRTIYMLGLRDNQKAILGLISIEIFSDHVYIHLVESSPQNIGKGKRYLGIGGNLFAFACKISHQSNHDGVVVFHAKTKLIEHYLVTLGAVLISKNRMCITEKSAILLLNKYYKDEKS
jgi:hypothetical protein